MPSPLHADSPAHQPPDRSTLDALIARARHLRGDIEAVRPADDDTGDPAARWQRALCELAAHHLDDLGGRLGQLREGAPPAPGEAGDPPVPDDGPRLRRHDGTPAAGYGPGSARPEFARRVGSADWNLLTDEVAWSDELYAIFGRRHEDGPLTLDDLPSCIVPEDQAALAAAVTDCLVDGRPVDQEFRIVRQDGGIRSVHMLGEPLLGADGATASLWAVLRDVSELRRSEGALASLVEGRDPAARAADRERTEAGVARRLHASLLPPWRGTPGDSGAGVPLPAGALDLAAHHLPTAADGRVGGTWYDAMTLPAGTTLLSTGDLTGHGVTAASGLAVVLGAVRGMAVAGIAPGALLEHLNRMLDVSAQPALGSALCCRYNPVDRSLSWAQAGHPAPLLFRGGTVRSLPSPEGVLLGVASSAVFGEHTERLEPGDVLLLHTEGLLPPDRGPAGNDRAGEWSSALAALAPQFAPARSAQECVRLAVHELGGPEREDEACLLIARIGD